MPDKFKNIDIKKVLKRADKESDKILNGLEKKLIHNYKASNKTLRQTLAEIYAKYDVPKKGLTFAEMNKYGRLKKANKEISRIMFELYQEDKTLLLRDLRTVYNNGYYPTAFAIEKTVQARLSYTLLDPKKISMAIQNPISGLTLNQTLAKNRADVIINLNREMTQGLLQGESYSKMAGRMTETLGGDANKAVRVARTEVHRVHNAARYDATLHADDIGVSMRKVWLSSIDARTRSAHQDLDGVDVGVKENFTSTAGGSGPTPGQLGNAADDINCFPGNTFILSPSNIMKGYKRYYEGYLVQITTATGIKLTGTANHPILTDKGWVELHKIKTGFNVVCAPFVKDIIPTNPDINNKPSMISEIFDFLSISGTRQRTCGINKQFHGDGANGDVDIVTMKSKLRNGRKTSFFNPFHKKKFTLANSGTRFLMPQSTFSHTVFRLFRASKHNISIVRELFFFRFRKITHTDIHGFAAVSLCYPSRNKSFDNSSPANIKDFGNMFDGFAGKMSFDNIIDIKIELFNGHIYNLQTNNSIYIAGNSISHNGVKNNGIVVHNCRCDHTIEVEGVKAEFRRIRGEGVVPYTTYNEWAKAKGIK